MHWNQIKTIFIICFLVLNIYLLFQYLEKQKEEDLHIQDESSNSIEEHLQNENITLNDLPNKVESESVIEVKQHIFSKDEIKEIKALNNVNTYIKDNSFIIGKFLNKKKLSQNIEQLEISSFLKTAIYKLEEYEFREWDKDLNVLIFFQKQKNRPVYFNQNGLLIIFLDNDQRLDFYVQTMLDKPLEQNKGENELIKAIQAVEILYRSNHLNSGDEITDANLGFYTRTPFLSGIQVFVPTWQITINDEKHYFVNALEGLSFPSEDEQFLEEVLEEESERFKDDNDDDLKEIYKKITKRLERMKQEDDA